MESLRYICWMLCLVQIVTVDGRPDFGTAFQFSATTSISRVSAEISSLFATMDDKLHFMMSGRIPNGEMQRQLMAVFAEDFTIAAKAVTDRLEEAASSTSSMGTTLTAALTAYDQFVAYMNAKANRFLQSTAQNFGLYLAYEFYNGLVRLVVSMPQLQRAINMLQGSLQTATVAEDVPSDRLRMLVKDLRFLKAHLPLMVYSFQRVGLNLQTAETFFVTFKLNQQSLPSNFMQEMVEFNAELTTIEERVGTKLTAVELAFNNTGAQLENDLTGDVQNQAGFMQIKTALTTFTSLRSVFVKNLIETLLPTSTAYRLSAETLLNQTYYFDSSVTLDSPALDLVALLIQSNVFDKMCYNKFAALVSDLPHLGQIRLAECFNTELPRLRKLQEMVEMYGLMVSYDGSDLWNNLKPCRSEFASSSCMAEVGAFYPRLYAARDDDSETQAGNFFTTALAASLNRIDLCFTNTNFFTFQKQVPTLRRSIMSCFNGLS